MSDGPYVPSRAAAAAAHRRVAGGNPVFSRALIKQTRSLLRRWERERGERSDAPPDSGSEPES